MDREIMETPREQIVISEGRLNYPTVVNTKPARAQVALQGEQPTS